MFFVFFIYLFVVCLFVYWFPCLFCNCFLGFFSVILSFFAACFFVACLFHSCFLDLFACLFVCLLLACLFACLFIDFSPCLVYMFLCCKLFDMVCRLKIMSHFTHVIYEQYR